MKPPLFSCLTSRIAKNGSLYGRFLFGPLPIDISLTVATVLRRSLLHSQATFTIVSTEIDGATHEYASLPGIQESVLEILLNLGEIVLTSTQRNFINPNFRTSFGWLAKLGPSWPEGVWRGPSGQQGPSFATQGTKSFASPEVPSTGFSFAFIRVSGPGVVTAKDIKWPKGIFCVKPNTYIATLSSNETLTMRLKIACLLNKNRNAFYDVETKVSKSIASESSVGIAKLLAQRGGPKGQELRYPKGQENPLSPTKNSLLGTESTKNMLKDNMTNKHVLFPHNKKSFDSFKLQGLASTITSVNFSTVKTSPSTLLQTQFQEIKKNIIPSKTLESRWSQGPPRKISNTLPTEQTKELKLTGLRNQTRSLDSYSIRKQNLTALPFSKKISKQTIFLENKSTSIRNLSTYDNKKDEEQKNVTFRVFPGLFNDFINLSSIKKKVPERNVLEKSKPSHLEPVEFDTLSQINIPRQENSLFSTETNTNNFPLPAKKNKQKSTGKYELAVSSSSYPVEKVNFLIERDDELAGYRHRIILEVWTNGSISPRQAIFESIGSIIKLIYNFREPLRNNFNNKVFHDSSVY